MFDMIKKLESNIKTLKQEVAEEIVKLKRDA